MDVPISEALLKVSWRNVALEALMHRLHLVLTRTSVRSELDRCWQNDLQLEFCGGGGEVLYRGKLHVVVVAMRSWQMPFRELLLRSRVVDPFTERRTNSATVFGDTDDCRSKPIFVESMSTSSVINVISAARQSHARITRIKERTRSPHERQTSASTIFHTAGYLFDIWQGIAHG